MPDDLTTIAVRGNPPSVTTQCGYCSEWHETKLTDQQAVVLAMQLLMAATKTPVELLWPTTPGRSHG